MKKILVTRKLLQSNEDRLKEMYDVNLNKNDELYSQSKLIELSQGCEWAELHEVLRLPHKRLRPASG